MTISKLDYRGLKKLAPAGFELPTSVEVDFKQIPKDWSEYRKRLTATDPQTLRIRVNYLHTAGAKLMHAAGEIKKVLKETEGAEQMKKYRDALDDHIELLRKYETQRMEAIEHERTLGNAHNVDLVMSRDKTNKRQVF